jgi:hypothetical protein
VWIPEDLQQVEERQKSFLASVRERTDASASGQADVYETCFESFKEGLLDVVSRKPERPALPPGAKAKSVYLVCDQADLKRKELMSIQTYLRNRGHPVELPPFQGEPEELREAEEELISDTDAALIYYGSAKDVWVLRKRKNLLKVLSKKQTGRDYARALYLCVPKDEIKSGHYLSVPGHIYPEGDGFCPLLVLGDCEEFRTEKLDAFVDVLERGSSC